MKKFLSLIFLFSSFTAIAQEELVFKSVYKPNKVYTTSLLSLTKTSLDFSGSEEMLEKMKSNGMQNPFLFTGSNEFVSTTTTGSLTKEGTIPARIQYDKMKIVQNMGGEEKIEENSMTGMIIEGKYNSQNKLSIDTMISEKVSEEIKTSLKSTLENVQENIKFPQEPMHIGDTFLQKVPMQIPLAGLNPMNMEVTSVYKLIDIKNGKAQFYIVQDVSFDMNNNKADISATGKGSGTLEFDIDNFFINKFETELNMDMKIVSEQITINSKITSLSKLNVKIK